MTKIDPRLGRGLRKLQPDVTGGFGIPFNPMDMWFSKDAAEVRCYEKRETIFGQSFMSGFIMVLPVEQQL